MPAGLAGYNPRMSVAGPVVVTSLRPGNAVSGIGRVPASKSLAQRALLCAGLAEGATEIVGDLDGGDVRAALALIGEAGTRVEESSADRVRVTGNPPGRDKGWTAAGPVSAGESGTLARFATAAFGLCGAPGKRQEIRVEGTLRSRRSPALFEALRGCGAEVEPLGAPGGWPVRVSSPASIGKVGISDAGSSQELSALWIALASRGGPFPFDVRGLVPSATYLDLTRDVLARFGGTVSGDSVGGPLRAPEEPFLVEPDASAAAVLLAAACLSGGAVEVPGLDARSAQPDVRIVDLLARFGCRAGSGAGSIRAEGAPTMGADADLSATPDLAPVLAAVAAAAAIRAGATSRLGGLRTLPGKESSRIVVLARGLEQAGFETRAGADFLEIGPAKATGSSRTIVLDPCGDHRMAFAFALLGLVRDGITVAESDCVAKSWPGFWVELARLGARPEYGAATEYGTATVLPASRPKDGRKN